MRADPRLVQKRKTARRKRRQQLAFEQFKQTAQGRALKGVPWDALPEHARQLIMEKKQLRVVRNA